MLSYENRITGKVNVYRLEIKTTEKVEEFEQLLESNLEKPILIP